MITQHTEQEAREKWCPHVRLGANNYSSYNRVSHFFKEKPKESYCVGSGCMMWVWTDFDEETNKRHYGKCGLVK